MLTPSSRPPWRPIASWCLLVLAASGCGGTGTDPDPSQGGSGDGAFSATVDGVAYVADPATVSAEVEPSIAGGYEISALLQPGVGGHLMTINLYNVDATGTYPLGVGATIFGGYVTYSRTTGQTWHSPLTGYSGEVTITTLTTSRIVGTFQVFLSPFPATSATGTRSVTAGSFDVTIDGTAAPVPDDTGSRLSGSIGGTAYYAAYAALVHGSNTHVITTSNGSYMLDLLLTDVTGPGTYSISTTSPPVRSVQVRAGADAPSGTNCCWGPESGDAGSVTVTSLTADRMAGTFSVTLQPKSGSPASAPLSVTSGTFDLGFVGSP